MSSVIYGIVSVVALLLIIGYYCFVKNKDIWLFLLFLCVFLVNVGYFSISVSKILEEALLANRIAYLGSVFLPLCMFKSVTEVCRINIPRSAVIALICISFTVFVIAASQGYCDLYYKEVSLAFIDGSAKLVKVYGKLHIVYLFYLVAYFASMVITIAYAVIKKKITSHKYASAITAVVFLNIIIWLLEQLVPTDFEFLSVSYIASEIILLFLFSMMNDYALLEKTQLSVEENQPQIQPEICEEDNYTVLLSENFQRIVESWEYSEELTPRELEVFRLILDNKKRKEIADILCLSENTVKTHMSHIFTKLGASGKNDLIEKANNLIRDLQNRPV